MTPITRETAFEKFGMIQDKYIENADVTEALAAEREQPRRTAFLHSGWFAACICAVVGIAVYITILLLGRGTPTPLPPAGSRAETEAETAAETMSETEAGTAAETLSPINSETFSPSLHTEEFIRLIRAEGYWLGDSHKEFTGNVASVENVTPEGLWDDPAGTELFRLNQTTYAVKNGKIHLLSFWMMPNNILCVWDYDGDGTKDLFTLEDVGSGVIRVTLTAYNLTTMRSEAIVSADVGDIRNGTFTCTVENDRIYVNGSLLLWGYGRFDYALPEGELPKGEYQPGVIRLTFRKPYYGKLEELFPDVVIAEVRDIHRDNYNFYSSTYGGNDKESAEHYRSLIGTEYVVTLADKSDETLTAALEIMRSNPLVADAKQMYIAYPTG